MLYAISQQGLVVHEPQLLGKRRPDIFFTGATGLSFVADVTTVSDRETRRDPWRRYKRSSGGVCENLESRTADSIFVSMRTPMSIRSDDQRSGPRLVCGPDLLVRILF